MLKLYNKNHFLSSTFAKTTIKNIFLKTKEEVVEPYEAINVVGNHWKERMGMKPRDLEEEQELFEGYREYYQKLREKGAIK